MVNLLSIWDSWLFFPIITSVSDPINWLGSFLFCSLFFQVKTTMKSTNLITNQIGQSNTKWAENNDDWNVGSKSVVGVLDATCRCSPSINCMNFFPLGQLSVVSYSFTLCSTSNWSTSFHDVTTATITVTRFVNTVKGNLHDVIGYFLSITTN